MNYAHKHFQELQRRRREDEDSENRNLALIKETRLREAMAKMNHEDHIPDKEKYYRKQNETILRPVR